jgi:hypothetical protein
MIEDESYIYQSGRITQWKVSLIGVLVSHYGCAVFNNTTRATGRKVSHYKLIGKKSDVEIVNYMFAWLLLECQRLADTEAKGNGRVFVASYCEGFVEGIKTQLIKSRDESKVQASSQAIVRLDARCQEARTFMYSLHTNLRKINHTSYSQQNPMAFSAGQSKGASVHLGAALSGSKVKMLGN